MNGWTAAGGRHLALLLCGVTAGLAVWFGGGQTVAFLFGALAVINVYAVLVRWSTVRHAEVHRSVQSSIARAGDTMVVSTELKLSPRRQLPFTWIAVEEEWSRNGQRFCVMRRLFLIRPGKPIRYDYQLAHLPRGAYQSEGITATVGDLFGFAVKTMKVRASSETSARPSSADKSGLGFVVWPQPDPDIGIIRWSFGRRGWQDEVQWAGVREYQPGDRLSRIDWKASARGTGLKTKRFEHAGERSPVRIALDPGIEERELFEKAVRVGAGLLNLLNKKGAKVALVDGTGSPGKGEEAMDSPSPRSHAECSMDFGQMMEKLATAEPGSNQRLDEMLLHACESWPVRSLLVCVVSQLNQQLIDALQTLRKRHVQVALVQLPGNGQDDHLRDRNARTALQAMGCEVHVLPVHASAREAEGYKMAE